MGLRARNEKEKETMKKRILEAAVALIIADGYDELSMRKIATKIGYSPTTIYLYYKDKAKIVEDISKQIYEITVCNIKRALEENKDAVIVEQLELAFKAFICSMTDNAEMGKAVIRSGTSAIFGSGDENVAPEENGILLLQAILSKGQQQGVLRRLDDNASWMLITALLGFVMNVIENQLYLRGDWTSLVSTYTEILINGLAAGSH